MDTVPDRPEVQVEVGGVRLDTRARDDIIAVDVHEELGRHGRALLVVRNWDERADGEAHADDGPFAIGAGIVVALGYRDEVAPVFDGVVTGLRARFLPDRQPVLDVECRTRGVLLTGRRHTRAFDDADDGRVAQILADDHGLRADVGPGPSHEHLVQYDESDWELLARRAHTLGFVLYVRGDELVFRAPDRSGDPEVGLEWGASLLEIELDQELGQRAGHLAAFAWDPDTQAPVDAEAEADRSPFAIAVRPMPAAALHEAGWPARASVDPHSGPLAADEVRGRAKAAADRQALAHVSGHGRCLGAPVLRMDAWVELSGVGRRFSGAHYLTAVRHTLGPGGYFTEFQVGQPPRLAPGGPTPAERRLDGLHTGVVTDLDDPRGWGRVKVSFPWVGPDPLKLWARLALPAAGPDQGFFFIPDPGHEVVVAFLDGDPRFPVVLGSLWNGQHAPPLAVETANGVRGVISRSGHRLLLDDSDGAEAVRVETKGGHHLLLHDAEGVVELREQGGNRITLGADGIVLDAARGDVTVQSGAGKVVLSAAAGLDAGSQGPMRLESTATLDVQASAVLGITGALVKINS